MPTKEGRKKSHILSKNACLPCCTMCIQYLKSISFNSNLCLFPISDGRCFSPDTFHFTPLNDTKESQLLSSRPLFGVKFNKLFHNYLEKGGDKHFDKKLCMLRLQPALQS